MEKDIFNMQRSDVLIRFELLVFPLQRTEQPKYLHVCKCILKGFNSMLCPVLRSTVINML